MVCKIRVRIATQSKASEIVAPTLNPIKNARPHNFFILKKTHTHTIDTRYILPHYIQDKRSAIQISSKKKRKFVKGKNKSKIMGLRNSSKNQKAVKSERDSRSHTKFNLKRPPTQISKQNKF